MRRFLFVTDARPAEVYSKTGLLGDPALGGTLMEHPEPLPQTEIDAMVRRCNELFNPPVRCTCGGRFAIIHKSGCPYGGAMS